MQEPEVWVEQTDALVPLSRVNADWGSGRQEMEVVASTIRRGLTTDLPQQVRGGVGISVATGNVVLAPVEKTPGQVEPLATSWAGFSKNAPLPDSVPGGLQVDDLVLMLFGTDAMDPLPGRLSLQASGARASTPDTSVLDITGDIDVRVLFEIDSWVFSGSNTHMPLIAKWNTTGNQGSWALAALDGGGFYFLWTPDGTSGSSISMATAAWDPSIRRVALRFDLDTNNGSGQRVGRFWYKDATDPESVDMGSTLGWTQIGSSIVQAGTTSIFASTAELTIGTLHNGTLPFVNWQSYDGSVMAAQVRQEFSGTPRANPDFRTAGEVPFVDSAGRTWSLAGGATLEAAQPSTAVDLDVKPRGTKITDMVPGSGFQLGAYYFRTTEEDLRAENLLIGARTSDGTMADTVAVAVYRNVDWESGFLVAQGETVTSNETQITVPGITVNERATWLQVVADLGLYDDVTETYLGEFTAPAGVTKQISAPGSFTAGVDVAIGLGYRHVDAGTYAGDTWMSPNTGTRDRPTMSLAIAAREMFLLQPTDIPGHWSPWREGQPRRRTNRPIEIQHGFGIYRQAEPGAPAFRSISTQNVGVSSAIVARPPGTVEGDILIAVMTEDTGLTTEPSVTGDWTLIGDEEYSNVRMYIWWRRVTASEPASYTFTGSTVSSSVTASILAVMNAGEDAEVGASLLKSISSTADVDSILTPASSTRTRALDIRIGAGGFTDTLTPPVGWTERLDVTNPGSSIVLGIATREFPTAQENTGNQVFTVDTASLQQIVGATVTIAVLATEHEVLLPQLVGTVTQGGSDTDDPVLNLEVVDNSTCLQYPYTLDAIYADLTAEQFAYGPGLNPLWLIDNLLRRSGCYSHLVPPQDNAIFSATLMGSAQPEIYSPRDYTTRFGVRTPYLAHRFGDADLPVTFGEASFAHLALENGIARWEMTESLDVTPGISVAYRYALYFYVDYENSVTGTEARFQLESYDGSLPLGTFQMFLDRDTRQMTITSAGIGNPTATLDIPLSGFTALRFGWRTAAGTVLDVQVYQDDEVGDFASVSWEDISGSDFLLSVLTDGLLIGGVQLVKENSTGSQDPPAALSYRSNVELSPSLGELTGTPAIENQTAWQVITDLVAAEFGAFWIDERGIAVFRNRDELHGIGVEAYDVTARDSIMHLAWQESWDQVYASVRVPYQPIEADTTETFILWRSNDAEKINGGETTRVRVVSLSQSALGATVQFSVNSQADGSGTTAADVQVVYGELVDSNTFEFQLRNNAASTRWLVDTNGSPTLRVVATIAVILGEVEYEDAPASDESDKQLNVNPNHWRQTPAAAQAAATVIASDVTDPLPLLQRVEVKPDPRIQLGDIVNILDPVATQISQRAVIVDKQQSAVAGQMALTLGVRPLATQWSDFDAAWDADAEDTWSDFDAVWSGQTWADFDSDPDRTEAT